MATPRRAQAQRRAVTRRVFLTACLAGSMCQTLVGCHTRQLPAYPESSRHDVTAYLIASGWHTEIALPVGTISGPLETLTRDFPSAHYLLFGWGEHDYYMAQEPTAGDALRALLPGPAVLLVTALDRPPQDLLAGADIFEVGLSAAGFDRLVNYVWAAFDKSADGMLRRLAAGPSRDSVFYAATGRYSAAYTCNTWTAEALHVSGIPVTAVGVVFAGQVIDQMQALAGKLR
jgi:uncharacterized protein (TIGR02117 family)